MPGGMGEDPRDFDEKGTFSFELYNKRIQAELKAAESPPEVIQGQPSGPPVRRLEDIPVEGKLPEGTVPEGEGTIEIKPIGQPESGMTKERFLAMSPEERQKLMGSGALEKGLEGLKSSMTHAEARTAASEKAVGKKKNPPPQ